MNAYDTLREIRDELERRRATPETFVILDRLIAKAEPERESILSISQPMMLRHLLRQRDVLSSHLVEMDLLALAGDLDDRRPVRNEDDAPNATLESTGKPQQLHSYYKKQKEQKRTGKG